MSDLSVPASLWRRLAAASYDALLLAGVLVFGLLIAIGVSAAFKAVVPPRILWAGLFLLGFAFFGGSWTHGGQTLGMLPWRLKLRRPDRQAIRLPIAMLRYVAMLLFAALATLGVIKSIAGNGFQGGLTMAIASLDLWWCLIDSRARTMHDLVAGTEVVYLPKPA